MIDSIFYPKKWNSCQVKKIFFFFNGCTIGRKKIWSVTIWYSNSMPMDQDQSNLKPSLNYHKPYPKKLSMNFYENYVKFLTKYQNFFSNWDSILFLDTIIYLDIGENVGKCVCVYKISNVNTGLRSKERLKFT